MGGERRRRRLRRTGRTPFDAVPAPGSPVEPGPDDPTGGEHPTTDGTGDGTTSANDADGTGGDGTGGDGLDGSSNPGGLEPGGSNSGGSSSGSPGSSGPDGSKSGSGGSASGGSASGGSTSGGSDPGGLNPGDSDPGGPNPGGSSRSDASRATPGRTPRPAPPPQHRPSPADLADLTGSFALTAGVQDPDPPAPPPVEHHHHHHDHRFDDPAGERGLRGLVGGGSSQVNVVAAMRARDASRPTDDDLATAEADLPIVRRGWIPRDELPRTH